jgi:FkbM family methyltransferase
MTPKLYPSATKPVRPMSVSLYLKSLIIGTSLEEAAKKLRWLFGIKQRLNHPELWELYLEDQRLPLVLQKVLSENSCGVDVGCHIGSFLSLLTRYAPRGRHIAFEPSQLRGGHLKDRFPNATIHTCAVSDVAGVTMFQEDYARPGFSRLQGTVTASKPNTKSYEVETCRLDDILLRETRIDLLKLDIEGGELAALRGAVKSIRRFKPTILFECGSEYDMDEKKLSRHMLYEFITQDLSYEIFSFVDFLFGKGPMTFDEFRKCGLYPFRAFNFIARSR